MKRNNIIYCAPIVLFTYNRLDHLKKAINSLKKNKLSKFSDLIIFSDGARSKKYDYQVQDVRNYIKNIKGFKNIKVYLRDKNYGLSANIISGISKVFKKYDTAIILEDDLILNKYFLNYMNDGLKKYKNKKCVASIHGYVYPIKFKKKFPKYFFLRGADCWGWATWRRGWEKFNANGRELLKKIDKKDLKKEFNFNNSYDYYEMLKKQISGKNDSWAIRWYASAFLENMITLYPSNTFVKNIGIDGSGTHGSGISKVNFDKFSNKKYTNIKKIKIDLKENLIAKKYIEDYFFKKSDSFLRKLMKKFYYLFK